MLASTHAWTKERLAKIPEYKQQIVQLMSRGFYYSEIAAELGMTVRTIREWEQGDPEFRQDMIDAKHAQADTLEREAVRRARDGVEDLVINNGKVVMVPSRNEITGELEMVPLTRRTYSDTLLMFLLKGQRRDVYGDKIETENNHTINLDGARDRVAAKLLAVSQRREAAGVPDNAD